MKTYLVMYWDYSQTAPVAAFTNEAEAERYTQMLNSHGSGGYGVEKLALLEECPKEYEIWLGYAFVGYGPEDRYVRAGKTDDLCEAPKPISRDELGTYHEGKAPPFFVVHVEGTSEAQVRERYKERVTEGEAWLEQAKAYGAVT